MRFVLVLCLFLSLISAHGADDVYYLTSASPAPGQDLAKQSLYLNNTLDVLGIQYVATFDYPSIEVVSIEYGEDIPLTGPNLEPPDWFIVDIDPFRLPPDVPTIVVSLIWEVTPPFYGTFMPAGNDNHMLDIYFTVSDNVSVGDQYQIRFMNGLSTPAGGPPISNIYTYPPGYSVLLDWENNPITISEGFIRGDANGDGIFNGLIDGIHMLQWGFGGGPEPVCEDAGDADDDGNLHPLVDGLYLLNFQFTNGPPPPTPFSIPGGDPTQDSLTCE